MTPRLSIYFNIFNNGCQVPLEKRENPGLCVRNEYQSEKSDPRLYAHPQSLSGAETVGSAGYFTYKTFSVKHRYRWLAPCSQFRSIPSDCVSLRQSALGTALCCHCPVRLWGNDNGCGQDGTSSACTLRAETARIAKCRAPVDPPEHAPVSRSRRLRT